MRSGQLGSVPAPAASRARGSNPGHAPHHRGIGVTPPGLDREKPRGTWGAGVRCRSGLLPTPTHKRRLRGSGGNASGSSRAAPVPSQGLGASSRLTGIVQAWRGCLTAGNLQAWRGARCLKTGKEHAPGPFPGARPDRSIVSPSYPGGPSWRNAAVWRCDRHGDRGQLPGVDPGRGPRPRAAWSSREGSRHGSSGRLTRMLVNVWYPRESKVEAWQLGGDLRSLVGRSARVPSLARASTRRLEFSRPTVTS